MKTEIIAWVLLSILGIVTVWLGYRAVEMHERVRKSIEELKKEIESMKTGIEMIAERESKTFTANGMSREELRLNYNAACNAYLAAFCEKHGYDYDPAAWVGNDPGGIAEVGDLFVSMADMLTDIDRDAPEEEYIKYYDYCMRVGAIANGELETPNYDSWLRGCPRLDEEQFRRMEELQRNIRDAELRLKAEIGKLNQF